jgi:hypothetical protein
VPPLPEPGDPVTVSCTARRLHGRPRQILGLLRGAASSLVGVCVGWKFDGYMTWFKKSANIAGGRFLKTGRFVRQIGGKTGIDRSVLAGEIGPERMNPGSLALTHTGTAERDTALPRRPFDVCASQESERERCLVAQGPCAMNGIKHAWLHSNPIDRVPAQQQQPYSPN